MAYRSLSSLVPNAADLLALEVEELAGVLRIHLNSDPTSANNIGHHNFFGLLAESKEYGDKQFQVNQALMEAWAWLQSAGLLVEKASSTAGWFFISRRGQQI